MYDVKHHPAISQSHFINKFYTFLWLIVAILNPRD